MNKDELTPKEREALVFETIKRFVLEEGRQLIEKENGPALGRISRLVDRKSKTQYEKFAYTFCHFKEVKKYFDKKYALAGECFTVEMLENEDYKELVKGTEPIIQRQLLFHQEMPSSVKLVKKRSKTKGRH